MSEEVPVGVLVGKPSKTHVFAYEGKSQLYIFAKPKDNRTVLRQYQ